MIKVMIVYEDTSKGLVRKGTATFSELEVGITRSS
jgi:hypothetical protein